ncbi:DNA polymerase III, beta chain [Legionella quinlivanii]|uniref:Beta sliding clamp n=1 Tax=Legionella quinlivanii TaxID=45073 RepID=A0A0W0Y5X5_9GAMM|nr:DNA polymerase III subunit beta [Legionella quinlivanii]KTD51982.1 DNA polymerase III, beta chain [Legionella quinlivanii]MCW8452242.1 DNA polymerase III subunit beta [Legionella quinlivanii]SEF86563.1 DNA polymerase III, beta subunit [Legionella quinlivanii DSM 21216]STY09555.1 DNA polymerase III, beta chain [Legionella quinlivanii]
MLSFSVAKTDLLPRLLVVSGAVDKRQSLAILSNFLLGLDNNQLTLTATDLEMEIASTLDCTSEVPGGKLTVPAKKFIDIIRSLDDDARPTISLQTNTLLIKSGRSQFKLATLPAEQFPACNQEQSEFQFSIARTALIHLFQSTHFAMSQQDVRIFLNGLLFNVDPSLITSVATDGHRMAICKYECDTGITDQRFLLPRKGIQEMLRLLNSIEDETVTVMAGKSHFRLNTSVYSFTSKLIEARYPPYMKAIPVDNDKFVLIEKDPLKRALSRIVILAHEKSRAVLMHIQPGAGITLIANNQEQEEAREQLEAQVDGSELKIGINASYLLDVLNFISDSHVRLSMSNTDRSILVESLTDEYYQYIIMPMKL